MKESEVKLTNEQEEIIDFWDAESDAKTRRNDWVNFAKEILATSRPAHAFSRPPMDAEEMAKRYDGFLRDVMVETHGDWFNKNVRVEVMSRILAWMKEGK